MRKTKIYIFRETTPEKLGKLVKAFSDAGISLSDDLTFTYDDQNQSEMEKIAELFEQYRKDIEKSESVDVCE